MLRETVKTCSTCKVDKYAEDFHKNRHRPDGFHSDCKSCVREANKRWRQANPDKVAAQKARYGERYSRRLTLAPYGLTEQEYQDLLDGQQGVCAICAGVNDDGKHLAVDHCHETGRVRGLLCRNCNLALGNFRDNKDFLANAIAYLGE